MRHDARLVFAQRGAQGDELAVQVAFRHGVAVYKGQTAHARPHQRFRRERTHAADAEHIHMRGAKLSKIFFSDERDLAPICLYHACLRILL